jgi:hypothetical protein
MDLAHGTPLLDCFRRGDVPRDVRLLAAQGGLAPRASEQIALLVHLAADSDAEVGQAAETTIGALPHDAVAALLARSETSDQVIAFFGRRGIQPAPAAVRAEDGDAPLVDLAGESADDELQGSAGDSPDAPARVPLSSMAVPARLKVAMKGTREQRAVLIRDPNKMVAAAVLSSPKLSDTEIESFSRMTNVSEEVLRVIGTSRGWVRKQAVAAALVKNPKTPPAISLSLLSRLTARDLKMLTTDRNVPEVLRLSARKMIATQDARKQ